MEVGHRQVGSWDSACACAGQGWAGLLCGAHAGGCLAALT